MGKKLRFLVFDPGARWTGLALFHDGELIGSVTWDGWEETLRNIASAKDHLWDEYPVWVIERYTVRANHPSGTNVPITAHVIGALLLAAEQLKCRVVFQEPWVANRAVTKKQVISRGWRWGSEHELDAIKHGLYRILISKGD